MFPEGALGAPGKVPSLSRCTHAGIDRLVLEPRHNVAREIQRREARVLVIDVSGVPVFDNYMARAVRDLPRLAKLMGCVPWSGDDPSGGARLL